MPTKESLMEGFQMGPWSVLPERGLLRQGDDQTHIEPLVMDVLMALAVCQGDVVSNDQLVDAVWGGRPVTDDVIVRCIAVLRRSLGDHARAPDYIENIPRRGYRLKMPITQQLDNTGDDQPPRSRAKAAYYMPLAAGFSALVIIVMFAFFIPGQDGADTGIRSLAVFPLECATADRILCYSVSEELISKLLQAQDGNDINVVRSRDPYPEDSTEETIADDLNIDGVFIGSLTRSGNDIHINAEIHDHRSGFVFWSKTYDTSLDEVTNIRSVLADDVVAKLIGDGAKSLVPDSRPQSFAALDAYTTGQYEFSIRSTDSIRKAIENFEKTIELDPGFGPAYVRLAYAYALLPEYTLESRNLLYEKALLIADRGVAIDPTVSDLAQTVYGFIYHKRGQWTRATKAHLQAINSSTVYPISHQLYSRLLASVGRLDASLRQAQKAREIDPQQAVLISRLAIAYLWVDDLENAGTYFARSDARRDYEAPIHDLAYALFYIRKGDYERAAEAAIAGLEKYGFDTSWVAAVFEGMHNPEKYDQAHLVVERLADGNHLSATVEITLWALLDDGERAMTVAKRLEDSGEIFEAELMFVPQFSALREHPQFPALLDAIGLTAYWRDNGCEWQIDHVACEADKGSVVRSMR